jgi:phosphoglycolate phosphatase-like HAD superfamily hydrolase
MVWLRPDRSLVAPHALDTLDTVLFDVDGVLIETTRSYRLAVIHATDRLVRVFLGLADAPDPLLTLEDVAAFKLAGGFNSDWDLTQALTALWTARLREWRGQPVAEVSVREWAARASDAARAGHGGTAWMRATFPASAIPSYDVARWACDEFYWGAALVRELLDHEPEYAPEATGFVHNETLLLPKDLLPTLVGAGIRHLGLITGRLGPEVGWAVQELAAACAPDPAADGGASPFGWHDGPYGRSPFAVVVSADLLVKPDPRALVHAAREVGAVGGVYVGDTADDLDLVLRYRAELQPNDTALPPFWAVMVASGPDVEVYAARGADAVIAHVGELPAALAALRQETPLGAESEGGQREPVDCEKP